MSSDPVNPDDKAPSSEGIFENMLETSGRPQSASKENPFVLAVQTGRHQGKIFELTASAAKIGRASDCDLRLSRSIGVSRHHALVTYDGTNYFIEDTNSRNGVLINHDLIESKTQLTPGDVIGLDEERIIFQYINELGVALSSVRAQRQTLAPSQDFASMPVTDPRAHERFSLSGTKESPSTQRSTTEIAEANQRSLEAKPTRKFDLNAVQTAVETTAEEDIFSESKTSFEPEPVFSKESNENSEPPAAHTKEPTWLHRQDPKGFALGAAVGFSIALGLGYAFLS